MKVVIIGGGIVGASAAYHLAKKQHEVILIDDQREGQATEHAAGIICPWLSKRRNNTWYELAKKSAAYYQPLAYELEKLTQLNTGYVQNGALLLRDTAEKADELAELAASRRKDAPEIGKIERLNRRETVARFPLLAAQYEGVFVSGGARVSGRALRDALLSGAKANGLKQINAQASLSRSGEKVLVNANDEIVFYDMLLITAGAWLKQLLLPIGYQ